MKSSHKTFKQILARKTGTFGELIHKITHLQQLTSILHTILANLDPVLIDHCYVANLRNSTLIIAVDSSAFATHLRYLFPELLMRLRLEAGLFEISQLKTTVHVLPVEPAKPKASRPKISASSAAILEEAANCLDDTRLAESLRKLAKTKQ